MSFKSYAITTLTVAGLSGIGGGWVGRYELPYIDPVLLEKAQGCTVDGEHVITRVVDGDTQAIELCGIEETMRLIGLNTPETHDTKTGVQCYGKEAEQKAKELLLGKKVRLETDPSQSKKGRDMHGRLLVYIHLPSGKNYAEYMIAEGFAHEERYQKAYKYEAQFKDAEQLAKAAKKGMWASDDCADESEKTTVRMQDRKK